VGPCKSRLVRGWSLWTAGVALGLAAQFLSRQPMGKPCQWKKVKSPAYWERHSLSCDGGCFGSSHVQICVTSPSQTPTWLVCAGSPLARGLRHVWKAGSEMACSPPSSLRHVALPGVFFSAENKKNGDTFAALLQYVICCNDSGEA